MEEFDGKTIGKGIRIDICSGKLLLVRKLKNEQSFSIIIKSELHSKLPNEKYIIPSPWEILLDEALENKKPKAVL